MTMAPGTAAVGPVGAALEAEPPAGARHGPPTRRYRRPTPLQGHPGASNRPRRAEGLAIATHPFVAEDQDGHGRPTAHLDPLFGLAEDDPKRRLAQAAVRCLDDVAMNDLGLEAVAREAGLSRATLYRVFPDGRDELLRTALATEVAEFWRNLANVVAGETTLEGRLTRGLIDGVLRTENHALLQRLVHQEAEEFAPFLDELEPAVFTLLSAYLADLLDRFSSDLAPGVDHDEASRYLATLILSYLSSPASIDFTDETRVAHLVRTQLLGGILTPVAMSNVPPADARRDGRHAGR